jgi:shikimate dehydrogenase
MPGQIALLLGHPVSQSLSPVMQNAAFHDSGLGAVYRTHDVLPEALDAMLERLEADEQFLGCNVTVPHKGAVYEWLKSKGRVLLPAAVTFEAVNTLFRGTDGLWCGDSTDYEGFLLSLRKGTQLLPISFEEWISSHDVAILGAGGSARSLARGLSCETRFAPRSVHVFARNLQKAQGIVPENRTHFLDEFPAWNKGRATLVIQTTTVGMATGEAAGMSPVPPDALDAGQVACDIVYKPHETPFLRDASARGAHVIPGIGMLVGQGAVACQKWLAGAGLKKDIFHLMNTMERALAEAGA